MKCINCNNDIPDGVTACPVCGSSVNQIPVDGQISTVPVDTSVLPVVPDTPVLPMDQTATAVDGTNQQMNVNAQANQGAVQASATEQANVTNQANAPEETNALNQVGVENLQSNLGQAGVPMNSESKTSEQAPVEGIQSSVQNAPMAQMNGIIEPAPVQQGGASQAPQQDVVQALPQQDAVQPPIADAATTVVNDINPEFIQPNGESVKLGNTLSLEDKRKKNKKNLLIILAIVFVLAVIGVVFLLYYNSQYKSAGKRIDAIVSALTVKTKSLKNDVIERTSGTYDISLGISSEEDNISVKMDGNYAVDLSGKAMDYTLNLTSLNLGEELIDSPINLELYLNESRAYVLLQNYFDSYIYDEVEGLSTIFDVNEQNNVDYVSIINALKVALATGIKSMSSTQSVENITIHGTSKKSNVIKIDFNERNRKIFLKSFFRSLANNKKFVTDASKFFDSSEEDFKNELESVINDDNLAIDMEDLDIEIYTALFNNEFHGIKVSSKSSENRSVMEVYPTVNGYGLSLKEGSQNVLDLTYESTSKTTSTTVENQMKFVLIVYSDGKAYNIDLDYKNVRDVNPKDAKVNVKNSINRKYLTEEQKQSIMTASQNSGKVGLYLPAILSIYLNGGIDYGDMGVDFPDGSMLPEENPVPDGTSTGEIDCTLDPSLCL